MRRCGKTPFRLNQRLFFMYVFLFSICFLVEVDNCNPVPCRTQKSFSQALLIKALASSDSALQFTWRNRAKRCLSEDLAPVAYSSRAEANLKRSDNVIEEILLKPRQFVNPFFIR